jgi:hypothetical protein
MAYCFQKKYKKNNESGQLLLEMLLAISAFVVVAMVGSQLVLVSQVSNKLSGDKSVASGVAEEIFEAVQNVATEDWQLVYGLNKGAGNLYHPEKSGNKWILASGNETVNLNGIDYVRSFYVEDVSRNPSTQNIESAYNIANDDPSTQKITINIAWPNADPITSNEYITRWRNRTCAQSDWSGGGGGAVGTCPNNTYDSSSNINAGTDLKLNF